MNEVLIVSHPGDNLETLLLSAMEIVKIKTVSYCAFEFNGIKLFYKKDSSPDSVMDEYFEKIKPEQP
jgi:hypothetical protein